ncbi:hypothetical protein SteCoe_33171 [Stentor coeruleus]|uniref:Dickkopf N-terminal cysteine-rich domain-containing protein n=1 Tax=Stentor coeruleus TaxID=5963 RepID=A0A1R2AXA5_9CILI|nr:hypothetical protein SteCoe_33171 [Stentor coeruleus]
MLFGLLIAPLLVSGTSCPVFKCGSSTATSGQCIAYTNSSGVDNYKITPCVTGLTCNYAKQSNAICEFPTDYMPRYPGEYCFDNLDCHSGICSTNGQCLGLKSGDACDMTYQCGTGLFCNSTSSVCETLLVNGTACGDTSQCSNSVCDSGVCTAYFSKATGQPATAISTQGLAWACITGFASKNLCAVAPVSNSTTSAATCTVGGTCTAKDGINTKPCTCSYNGKAYCPLFEGDTQVQNMITGIQKILPNNINCHTLNRFSYECFATMYGDQAFTDYLAWAANAQLYLNNEWVLQHTSLKCVNETLQASYLNIVNQNNGITQQCPVYTETNYTEGWNNNTCIFATDDIYYSNLFTTFQAKPSACTNGQVCHALVSAEATNSTCYTPPAAVRYPGDYCTESTQCSSGTCTNKVCTGLSIGAKCTSLYSCNPGLYCDTANTVCVASVPQSGVCSSTVYCQANLTCNLGICVPFYSVALNGPVNPISGGYGFSTVCASGFAALDSKTGATICMTAPVSPSKSVNAVCTPGNSCLDSTGTYKKACTCGTNGMAYCPTFEGDYASTKAIYYHKKIISYQSNCNTIMVESYCYMKSSTIYKYYKYYLTYYQEFTSYPLLIDSKDSFIGDLYFSAYWSAYDSVRDSSFGANLAISMIAFVAFNI